ESHRFGLLDLDTSDESSEDKLIKSNKEDKNIELSKSEAELTENNIDSE
ncbi:4072_t:CDS:1, partial [Racocetra persica]